MLIFRGRRGCQGSWIGSKLSGLSRFIRSQRAVAPEKPPKSKTENLPWKCFFVRVYGFRVLWGVLGFWGGLFFWGGLRLSFLLRVFEILGPDGCYRHCIRVQNLLGVLFLLVTNFLASSCNLLNKQNPPIGPSLDLLGSCHHF